MKIYKNIVFLLCLPVLLLNLSACREKTEISVYDSYVAFSDETFYGAPEMIVKATVQKKVKEYFTNPEGDPNRNAHITVFDIEISEVYKGAPESMNLQLKMFNGQGMSPDLYLYGEDDHYVLEEKEEPFLLEIGQEYILGIIYTYPERAECYGDEGGYVIKFGEAWCFTQNEDGTYENQGGGINYKKLDIATLKERIAALPQE